MVRLEYLAFEHNNAAAELVRQAYDTPPLAFVHSYGCQQNVNDGERIKGVLVDIGYGLCEKPEDADLILFNTCAVREHAEQRVFGNVGALKGLKEKKPGLIIGLCGCMANQKHVVEKLRQSYPYVDLVFGVDGIDTLPQLVAQKLQKHKRVLLEPAQRPVIVENIPIRRESEFRAWLPIMYGCDNFCTYCIVPYVRGREKSRKPGDILAEFKGLVEAGYKEITLLGQNVNSYGKGLEEKIDFSNLLNLLCTVPGDYHIRFMTSHPKDASFKLIDTIAAQPKICKHGHESGGNAGPDPPQGEDGPDEPPAGRAGRDRNGVGQSTGRADRPGSGRGLWPCGGNSLRPPGQQPDRRVCRGRQPHGQLCHGAPDGCPGHCSGG